METILSYQRRQWHPTPVLLPGKSHGWRSLVGCSPWGGKESDTTEQLPFHFSLSCIGEGNGNPFQCSCLENPRDRGAWWTAVYGVTQSRTWLKWLSNSSSSVLIRRPPYEKRHKKNAMWQWRQRLEWSSCKPRLLANHQKLGRFHRLQREYWPANMLFSNFQRPELWDNVFLLF